MSADAVQTDQHETGDVTPSPFAKPLPPRMRTNTAEIDNTITHPGSVKINVQGAFIVDQDSVSPNGSISAVNGGSHDTKDIRLPNHTAVVSHIAVDVCYFQCAHVQNCVPAFLCAIQSITNHNGRLEAP